jgi:hypothetical protein
MVVLLQVSKLGTCLSGAATVDARQFAQRSMPASEESCRRRGHTFGVCPIRAVASVIPRGCLMG